MFVMSAVPNLPEDTPVIESNGAANGALMSPFKLHDSPIENFRPIKVIVIGAGYSGIYCGIRIPEKLRNVELVIYEKNEGVGGTWWENRSARLCCLHWWSISGPCRAVTKLTCAQIFRLRL